MKPSDSSKSRLPKIRRISKNPLILKLRSAVLAYRNALLISTGACQNSRSFPIREDVIGKKFSWDLTIPLGPSASSLANGTSSAISKPHFVQVKIPSEFITKSALWHSVQGDKENNSEFFAGVHMIRI